MGGWGADTWQGGYDKLIYTKYHIPELVNGSLQIDSMININWSQIDPQAKTNMEADTDFSALNWLRNAINDLANHVIL